MGLRHRMHQVVLLAVWALLVDGSGKISVRLDEFNNPEGKISNGNCCDGITYFCRGECDHYFVVCLDYIDGSDDTGDCPLGKYTTEVIKDQKQITFGGTIGNTPNPKTLHFTEWRTNAKGMKVKVGVWDSDGNNDNDFVEDLIKTVADLSPARSFRQAGTARVTLTGDDLNTELTIGLQVYCDHSWYGDECDVQCSTAHDSHYDCDADTGNKICHPGWAGEDCTVEVDECEDLSCPPGGFCIHEGDHVSCQCHPGYTGQFCEDDIDDCVDGDGEPVCHGSAKCADGVNEYRCICSKDWGGNHCEVFLGEDMDPCTSQPCHNGATCRDDIDGFICHCAPGWTGEQCTSNIAEATTGETDAKRCEGAMCAHNETRYACHGAECGNGATGNYNWFILFGQTLLFLLMVNS